MSRCLKNPGGGVLSGHMVKQPLCALAALREDALALFLLGAEGFIQSTARLCLWYNLWPISKDGGSHGQDDRTGCFCDYSGS